MNEISVEQVQCLHLLTHVLIDTLSLAFKSISEILIFIESAPAIVKNLVIWPNTGKAV